MADYTKDLEFARRVGGAAGKLRVCEHLGHVVEAVGKAVRSKAVAGIGGAMVSVGGTASRSESLVECIWSSRHGDVRHSSCSLVKSVAMSSETVARLTAYYGERSVRDVFGIPVIIDGSTITEDYLSPATREEILARIAAAPHPWYIDEDGGLHPEVSNVHSRLAEKTRTLIERTKKFDCCRALTLCGPPRAGKSSAARQIMRELCGTSWVRVCGRSATSKAVWSALHVLRPKGLIFDDLDSNAGSESALLEQFERAHTWARVIVSTVNVLPSGVGHGADTPEDDDGSVIKTETGMFESARPGELRGALISMGRARDEKPVRYDSLDPEIRKAIGPDVPEHMLVDELRAGPIEELQKRARAGVICDADLDEMLEYQREVGER